MRKMGKKATFPTMVWIGALLLALLWAFLTKDIVALKIMAPQDPEAELPIYAQFTVTQKVTIEEPFILSKVVIPMNIDSTEHPLDISILDDGLVLQTVTKEFVQTSVQDIEVVLDTPARIEGEMRVVIDGKQFEHEDKDVAPKIFLEKDDAAFDNGNYVIAANEKKGDVGMTLYSSVSNVHHLKSTFEKRPYDTIAKALLWILVVAVLAQVPTIVISQNEERTTPETTA